MTKRKKHNPLKRAEMACKIALKHAAVRNVVGNGGCELIDVRDNRLIRVTPMIEKSIRKSGITGNT